MKSPEHFCIDRVSDEKRPDDLEGYDKDSELSDKTQPREQGVMTDEEFAIEVEKRMVELQRLIDGNKRLFASFAGDSSLNFILSDGFYFLPEKGEVHIATEWFFQEGYTHEQIIWACFHELAHFRDMIADPEAYLENFAYIREKARDTGKALELKWRAKYEEHDPEFIEDITRQRPVDENDHRKGTMSKIEMSAYQMHHRFWNVMDDIYVNNDVRDRAGRYRKGSEADKEVVEKLYKEKLFPGHDYTMGVDQLTGGQVGAGMSRNAQFLNKLLRDEMVHDERVVVDDEVRDVLGTEHMRLGNIWTVQSLIDTRLKPTKGLDTTPGTRYALLKKTIEPLFTNFLLRDIDEMDVQKPEKQQGRGDDGSESGGGQGDPSQIAPDEQGGDTKPHGEGDEGGSEAGGEPEGNAGEPGGKDDGEEGGGKNEDGEDDSGITPNDLNPFVNDFPDDQSNPDQFSEKDIEDFVARAKVAKDAAERLKNMTPEERAREEHKKQQRAWDETRNITLEQRRDFDGVVQRITPYLDDMVDLWRSIAYGTTRNLEVHDVGHFRTGHLDVGEVVRQYPEMKSAAQRGALDQVKVYRRTESREIHSLKPELIKVRFLGDLSGSMGKEKRRVLKETMALVLLSLKEFNTYLDRTRKSTGTKLRVETEAWIFGSDFAQIKSPEHDYGEEDAAIIKAVTAVDKNLGTTRDYALLQHIQENRTLTERQMVAEEKAMEIILEVTDGVPHDGKKDRATDTRTEVDVLTDDNVIMRGFQIGDVSSEDMQIFETIWNSGRQMPLGEVIGSDIAKLPIAVAQTMKKYLGNIKI